MYLLELAGDDADPFAVCEARTRCSAVERLAPGVATARGVDTATVGTLAYTRRVCRLVGTCSPDIAAAAATLKAASVDRTGTVAVRARDVRGLADIDTQAAERRLGSVLVDRGFEVDLDAPEHTLVALFSADAAAVGWLSTETTRDFTDRRPTEKPFFQPGSMDPMDARAVANIAGAAPNVRILDPMCGTGGILVEAGLAGATPVGVDAQPKMVSGARQNLDHYLTDGAVLRGDATRLPFAADSFDGAVFDAPYGRQSKIEGQSLEIIVGEALEEVRRVAGRTVLIADRPWNEAAEAAGWTVAERFDRRVHGSLTRYIHVLR